jgi:hypothetical protein
MTNVVHYDADGEYHHDGGPAVESTTGEKYWYQHGKLHREDGPAASSTKGIKEWWYMGLRHRIDGPAIEPQPGEKAWSAWYVRGRQFTEEEFNLYVDQLTGDVLVPPGKRLDFE